MYADYSLGCMDPCRKSDGGRALGERSLLELPAGVMPFSEAISKPKLEAPRVHEESTLHTASFTQQLEESALQFPGQACGDPPGTSAMQPSR